MLSKLRSVKLLLNVVLFFVCFSSQVLALCHVALGQQLNLHWLHKVMCQMWDWATVLVWVVKIGRWLVVGEFYICIFLCVCVCLWWGCLHTYLSAWCLCVCSIIADQLNSSWTYSLDRVVPGGLWKPRKWPGLTCYQQTKHCLGCERAGSYVGLFCGLCVHECFSLAHCFWMYPKWQPLCFSLSLPSLSPQIGVTAALLTTIVGVISVNQTWGQEWDVIPISLQVSTLRRRITPQLLLMAFDVS